MSSASLPQKHQKQSQTGGDVHGTLKTQLPSWRGFELSPEWLATWWTPPRGKRQGDVLSNPWDAYVCTRVEARNKLTGRSRRICEGSGTKPRGRPRCSSPFGRPETGDWSTSENVVLESRGTWREARLGYPRIPTSLVQPNRLIPAKPSLSSLDLRISRSFLPTTLPYAGIRLQPQHVPRRFEMPVKCSTITPVRRGEIQMGV